MGFRNLFSQFKQTFTSTSGTKSNSTFGTPVSSVKSNYEWLGKYSPYNFDKISEEAAIKDGYLSNEDIFSIISYIAKIGSTLDLVLQEEKSDGTIEVVEKTDKLYKLLMKPNDHQTKNDYFYELITNYLLTGSVYQLKNMSVGFNIPSSMFILPTQYVTPFKNTEDDFIDPIRGYYFSYNAKRVEYNPSEIIEIVMFDPSYTSLKGVSPLQSGRLALETSNTIHNAECSSIENNGASGIITSKNETYPLTSEERETVDNNFKKRSGGSNNFNKILTLNGSIEYTEIGKTPKELDLSTIDISKLRKFCNLYGVSSQLFNDPANKTFNNLKEAKASLYTDLLIPLINKIIESMNVYLIDDINQSLSKNYLLSLNVDKIDVLQKDKKQEAEKNKIKSESLLNILKEITSGSISAETGKDILVYTLGLDETFAEKVTSSLIVQTTEATEINNNEENNSEDE
jgi:HK97 family phage portal protein